MTVLTRRPLQGGQVAHGSPVRAQAPSRSRRLVVRLVNVVWPLVAVIGAWALWVEVGNIPPAVAPAPFDVLTYLVSNPTDFVRDAASTILVVAGGMVLGLIGGIALAVCSWFSPVARAMISGPALVTQCLPVVTISPVLARVFGYNTSTIVLIAALICFFPVFIYTSAGMRQMPPGSSDVFKAFGASRWQTLWRLALPSSISRILVALRVSIVSAVVGAMLAQWIMGTSGLGHRLVVAQAAFRTSEAWAASLVAIVLALVLYSLMAVACRRASARFE